VRRNVILCVGIFAILVVVGFALNSRPGLNEDVSTAKEIPSVQSLEASGEVAEAEPTHNSEQPVPELPIPVQPSATGQSTSIIQYGIAGISGGFGGSSDGSFRGGSFTGGFCGSLGAFGGTGTGVSFQFPEGRTIDGSSNSTPIPINKTR
jgi:hypothetical protein